MIQYSLCTLSLQLEGRNALLDANLLCTFLNFGCFSVGGIKCTKFIYNLNKLAPIKISQVHLMVFIPAKDIPLYMNFQDTYL